MEGGKGGNSYWPGFVDALTNVVIAMIFVIVVLAIALSFAAQLMGKKLAEQYIAAAASAASAAGNPSGSTLQGQPPPIPESKRAGRTHIAVAASEAASTVSATRMAVARNVLQLDFAANALTLNAPAADQLKTALKDIPRKERVTITATGPDMQISVNQRSAYLRVMAVRNVMIEQGFKADIITTRIDTQTHTPGATVNVSFQEAK